MFSVPSTTDLVDTTHLGVLDSPLDLRTIPWPYLTRKTILWFKQWLATVFSNRYSLTERHNIGIALNHRWKCGSISDLHGEIEMKIEYRSASTASSKLARWHPFFFANSVKRNNHLKLSKSPALTPPPPDPNHADNNSTIKGGFKLYISSSS